MGIFDLTSPIFNLLEGASSLLPKGTSRKPKSDLVDYLKEEIEELKNKKGVLEEAMKGPETGINPPQDIAYGMVLVDDEGVLVSVKRAERNKLESQMRMDSGVKPQIPIEETFTPQERAWWDKYVSDRGGTLKEYYSDYGYEGQGITTRYYAWMNDYKLFERKKISHEQLIARSYRSPNELDTIKRSIIESFRRERMIDPAINVPIF